MGIEDPDDLDENDDLIQEILALGHHDNHPSRLLLLLSGKRFKLLNYVCGWDKTPIPYIFNETSN